MHNMMTILYQENMDDQKQNHTYIHELDTSRRTIVNMAIVKVVYSSLQK